MPNIYRAKEPFFVFTDGIPRRIKGGDLVTDDDPAYDGRENHFEPVEVAAARMATVESATAAPGEHRSVTTVTKRRGRPRRTRPVVDDLGHQPVPEPEPPEPQEETP